MPSNQTREQPSKDIIPAASSNSTACHKASQSSHCHTSFLVFARWLLQVIMQWCSNGLIWNTCAGRNVACASEVYVATFRCEADQLTRNHLSMSTTDRLLNEFVMSGQNLQSMPKLRKTRTRHAVNSMASSNTSHAGNSTANAPCHTARLGRASTFRKLDWDQTPHCLASYILQCRSSV